jgi:hypothetical protein
MKNSNDTIGNRTCDPPAYKAVPQQTAPPHAPSPYQKKWKYGTLLTCKIFFRNNHNETLELAAV